MMTRRVVVSMEVSWLNQTEQLPPWNPRARQGGDEYEPYLASQGPRNSVLPKITTHEMSVSAKMRRIRAEIVPHGRAESTTDQPRAFDSLTMGSRASHSPQ